MARIYGMVMQAIKSCIGNKTDAASSTGSVHAKLNYIMPKLNLSFLTASDTVRKNDTASYSQSGTTPVAKASTFNIPASGIVRIKFDGYSTDYLAQLYCRAVGTSAWIFIGTAAYSTGAYTTYTYDIALPAGKYEYGLCVSQGAGVAYAKNFRVCADLAADIPASF